MSNRIITIEREYASGGREVGELVAKQLGIPFYNREILEMASERCGVSVDYLASAEEAAPKSFLYTLMLSSNPTRSIQENLPLSDKVYIIETNIIKELAEKSDCVIVGRCASEEINLTCKAFLENDKEMAQRVAPLGMVITTLCDELKMRHVERMSNGGCGLEEGTVFTDILNSFNRIAAHCASAMVALMNSDKENMDTHIHDSK